MIPPEVQCHRSRMFMNNAELQAVNIEEWREKSLLEKLSDSYNGRQHDPVTTKYAHALSIVFFIFTITSLLHLFLNHFVPVNYGHWQPEDRYYIKVLACFIFVQTVANYTCVMCYHSFVERNDDNDVCGIADHKNTRSSDGRFRPTDASVEQCRVDNKFGDKFCSRCNLYVPHRSHHCRICQKCVLKRDHHCFFTATCIGHYNQRYFVVLCFYISTGCIWGVSEVIHYMRDASFADGTSQWDYVLPVTFFQWFTGGLPITHFLVIWQIYNLWWIGIAASGFFVWNIFTIALGKTTHEVRTGIRVRSIATVSERFRFVFGPFWLTSFFFPSVLVFRQEHDGRNWTDLRRC